MNKPISETVSLLAPHVQAMRAGFEAALKTGAGGTLPRIEDHLAGLPATDRRALLCELVAVEITWRRQRGEQPRSDEYRARFPDLRPEWLTGILASTEEDGRVQPEKRGHTLRCPHCQNPIHLSDAPDDEVLCPGCGSSFRVREARFTDTTSASRPLGRFQLLERVGVGAFGAVWKARDTALDRIVALKILHSGLGTDEEEMQRFHREARATAQLRHPGVVTVHEVLTLDGLPVLVCDFVHGVTLKDLLEVRRLTFREAVQLVAGLAEALDYAHGMGVIHRDIKPANVMLEAVPADKTGDGRGELGRPLLMDFGLALRGGAEVTMTLDGHVLGTPAYMSPEQAAGKSHLADRRSDVYSLGVILYELLTGELPFRGSRAMILYQVLTEEPRPPRQLNAKVPRDLETVCLTCLHKEPRKRYASGRELADDLKRFLAGETIRARPVGRVERAWRWCRRNAAVASLLAAVALLLVAGTVVSMLFAFDAADQAQVARDKARDAETERLTADAERRKALESAGKAQAAETRANERATAAEAAERLERRRAYGVGMLLTQAAWEQHQVGHFLQLLDEYRPCKVGDEDFRGFEWFYWRRQFQRGHVTFKGHTGDVWSVAFSGDGKRIVSASPGDHTVKVWDTETGQELLSLKAHTGTFYCAAFSADGKRIAAGCWDKTVKVWNAHTGHEVLTLKGHVNAVMSVTFSADGNRIASADGGLQTRNGTVKVWDAHTGKEQLTLKGKTHSPNSVAFSPDGKHIASATWQALEVWDAHTGKQLLTLKGHTSDVKNVAFSPDGNRLASGSFDGAVKLWDAQTGEELLSLKGHTRGVQSVAFSPDGKRIVSGSWDRTVKVWDALSGQEQLTLKGHTASVQSVAFSPDGKRIASGGWDHTVKLWDAEAGQGPLTMEPKGALLRIYSVAFSADGKRIVSGGGGQDKQFKPMPGQVKVWDVQTGREQLSLKGHANEVLSVAFSPDGKRIASGSGGYDVKTRNRWGEVKVWDAQTGQELLTFKGHTDMVWGVAFYPDGARIASGSLDKTVKVWDAHTGREQFTFKGHTSGVLSLALSPDGKRIVSGSQDQTAKVWDAWTGQKQLSLEGHTIGVGNVAFSADGTHIASCSGKTVKLWDAHTGQEQFSLKGHTGGASSLAFSPDGKRIVLASEQTLKVCDARTGQEVLTIKGAHGPLALSADGTLIAAGSEETLKVWDAHSGQEGLTFKGHDLAVHGVAFSPDSKRIVSASWDRTVKVWDAHTGLEALTLKGHTGEVSSVALSVDGQRIASGSKDHTVRVWDAHTGKQTLALKGHTGEVVSVAFSDDGQRLASASWELYKPSEVKVWDAQTGQELLSLKGHRGWVRSVAFSSDGKTIAAGSGEFDLRTGKKWGEVKVWDAQTGKELFSLTGHTARVMSVAFSADGKRIVSGGEGFDPETRASWGELKVWDAQTGQELLSLRGHDNWILSVAFSADGNRIVSGSHDNTVKVWDAHTGQEQFSLKGHTGPVHSVAISPDGRRIASGSEDLTVNVWDAHTGKQALTPGLHSVGP